MEIIITTHPELVKRDEEPAPNEFDETAVGSQNSFYPEIVEPSYYAYDGDAVEPSDADVYDAVIAYPDFRSSAGRFFGPMERRISYESYSESPVFYDGQWNENETESTYDGSEQSPVDASVFHWPSTVAPVLDDRFRGISLLADSTESQQSSVSQSPVSDEEHPGAVAIGEPVKEDEPAGEIFQDDDDVTDYLELAAATPTMIDGSIRNSKSAFDIAMINAVLNSRPRHANLAVVSSSNDASSPPMDGVTTGSKRRRRVGLWESATSRSRDGSPEATMPAKESASLPVVFDAHDVPVYDVAPKFFFSGGGGGGVGGGVSAPTKINEDARSPLPGFRTGNVASFDSMVARSSYHRPIVRRVVPDVYATLSAAATSPDDPSWATSTPGM